MNDPNELLHISEGGEEIAGKLHTDIMRRILRHIMLRIGRGDDYILTAQDKWQIQTLQQAGYLLEDIQKDIAKATKLMQEEIAEAFEYAGVKSLEYDDKIYQAAGLSPTPLTQSPELLRIMQRNYEATMHEWSNFTRTTAVSAQQLFINQCDKAYTLVSTGALPYTQALKEVINEVVTDGVKVKYVNENTRAVHYDTIETATLRAIRTGVSQASAQIQLARMKEMGYSLAIVSSHMGARPSHTEWQGKVYSIDWDKMNQIYPLPDIPNPENDIKEIVKYPDLIDITGFGTVTGLCGANCRHSFGVYVEGMPNPYKKYDSEENKKVYEIEQRQRKLERRIRKTKQKVIGFKESMDNATDERAKFAFDSLYQKQSALLQKQNDYYQQYCAENNLRPLQERLMVAKWDRQQAAQARGAAQRYNNAKGN